MHGFFATKAFNESEGVDDPFTLAQRHEPVGKGIGVGQIYVLAEELQLSVTMQLLQFFEEA
jgi:hypothetical protein